MSEKEMFLTPNPYSRPKKKLGKVLGVVIHWYANPKSRAVANRNFFENRKFGKSGYGSAQYLVDDFDEVHAIPDDEMAYHVGSNVYTASALRNLGSYPNNCTIGIEMAHDDWTGRPNPATYEKTVKLAARLLKEHGLDETNLWTHHQVVGWKDCHRWYTENASEWVQFVADVAKLLHGKTIIIPTPKPAKPDDLVMVDILNEGDKGENVKTLQADLNKLGYKLKVDGDFGPATDKAVEDFQRKSNLTVDGAVGPKTASALEKAIGNLSKPKPDTKVHLVVKGDTLWGISEKYNVTVADLEKANPKIKEGVILRGSKVVIPNTKATPAPKPPAPRKFVRTYRYKSPMMIDKKLNTTDIAEIQKVAGVKADGYFGHNTELAVKRYQANHGLKADGIVGPNTWNKMF